MREGKAGRITVVVVATIVLIMAIVQCFTCAMPWSKCVLPWIWWYDLNEGDQASWVEAIGTILAVAATGGIFVWQRQHELADRQAQKAEEMRALKATQEKVLTLFGIVILPMRGSADIVCQTPFNTTDWVEYLKPVDICLENLRAGSNNLHRFTDLYQQLPIFHVPLLLSIELATQDAMEKLTTARASVEAGRRDAKEKVEAAVGQLQGFVSLCEFFHRASGPRGASPSR